MAMTPRDRRALLIFGVVILVAAAAFFLLPKATKKSAQSPSPVAGPAVTSTPTVSPTPKPKASPKEVLVFSGRDPFDPRQGGGTVTPAAFTSPTPSPTGTVASLPVLFLGQLFLSRRRRKGQARLEDKQL